MVEPVDDCSEFGGRKTYSREFDNGSKFYTWNDIYSSKFDDGNEEIEKKFDLLDPDLEAKTMSICTNLQISGKLL